VKDLFSEQNRLAQITHLSTIWIIGILVFSTFNVNEACHTVVIFIANTTYYLVAIQVDITIYTINKQQICLLKSIVKSCPFINHYLIWKVICYGSVSLWIPNWFLNRHIYNCIYYWLAVCKNGFNVFILLCYPFQHILCHVL